MEINEEETGQFNQFILNLITPRTALNQSNRRSERRSMMNLEYWFPNRENVLINERVRNPHMDNLDFITSFVEGVSRRLEENIVNEVLEASSQDNELSKVNTGFIKLEIKQFNQTTQEVKECRICLENLGKDENVGVLDCDHYFHEECIRQWGEYKYTCPLCIKDITCLSE